MAYNYFCCRRHVPPVQYAVEQLGEFRGYLCPRCPTCYETMEYYDTGTFSRDTRPVPPPRLAPVKPPKLSSKAVAIYSGNGNNPGHGQVTWEISRNEAQMDMTIKIMLGELRGGNYDSVQIFKMADGLLDTAQAGNKEDWWLNAPAKVATERACWHEIDLAVLLGAGKPAGLPPKLEIGVKLGNAAYGLIHLLAGHAKSVRNVGPYSIQIEKDDDPKDNIYHTLLSLQTGMKRFATNDITQIYHDAAKDKLLIKGKYSGLIVVTRMAGDPRFAITTLYNTSSPTFGNKIYG